MKISTKGRYGLRVMIQLAQSRPGKTTSLKEIAAQQDISEKYLWQVIRLLTAAKLISATRGSRGGYRLARSPEGISLKDIYFALEGPGNLVPCMEDDHLCTRTDTCISRDIWRDLEETIVSKMRSLSLSDILKHSDSRNNNLMYVI